MPQTTPVAKRRRPTGAIYGAGGWAFARQALFLVASALNFWLMELANADSGRVGLVMTAVLVIPLIIDSRKTIGRFLILGATWIAAYTLQKLLYEVNITGTRTLDSLHLFMAAIFIVLVIGVALIIWGKGKERNAEAPVRWVAGLVIVAICIAAGIAGIEALGKRDEEAGRTLGSIFYDVREVMHGNFEDSLGSYRGFIWRNALSVLPNNPIIGSGPDTFYQAFPQEAHSVYVPFDKAHNEYVQILICQGILGIISYLVFLGSAFIKSIKKTYMNPFVIPVLAGFVAYCIQAFFNISLPIASQAVWVFAGMLSCGKFHETPVQELR